MGRTKKTRTKRINYTVELVKMLLNASQYKDEDIDDMFTYSLALKPNTTFKIIFWYRFVQKDSAYLYRRMLKTMAMYNTGLVAANIYLIPMFGDHEDLVALSFDTTLGTEARKYIKHLERYPQEDLIKAYPLESPTKATDIVKLVSTHDLFKLINLPVIQN